MRKRVLDHRVKYQIEAGLADAAAGRVQTQQVVMQELQEILDR